MKENIIKNCKILKMAYIYNNFEEELKEARAQKKDSITFLNDILEKEVRQRKENTIKKRLQIAKFPYKKYLEDFDRSLYKPDIINEFDNLDSLEFIDNKENIILIGTPGSGKTHYAIGIGIKACLANKSVLFCSVPNLIIEMREAMSKNSFTSFRTKFIKYDLVILDELGYSSFDKASCESLFNLLSNRRDQGSVIVTTNLSFDRWEEVFHDPMLTGALVDRLAYKAHVLDVSREVSHRYEETVTWKKESSSNQVA